jgi:uncharacterized membrane-anchored protein YitT (DUF2179 family)
MSNNKVTNIEKAIDIDRKQKENNNKKNILRKRLIRIIMVFIGAFIAGFALEICLLPNSVIDGGVVGVSMILSHVTGISLSIFLIIINIPFVYFGYKQIGKSFAMYTLIGIIFLSFWTAIFESYDSFFHDTLLAAVFGGLILGVGIGIVMRAGGCMDGTEILAIVFSGKLPLSVGEIVMICNVFIFTAAGLILGWEQALYSMLTYFVVTKAIDIVLTGFNESKACFIITDKATEITEALLARLGRGITVMEAEGAYSGNQKIVLYVIITKLELSKLKSIVEDIDPKAFVTISDVYEVMGGNFKKKSIH